MAIVLVTGALPLELWSATTNAPKAKRDGPFFSVARFFRGPIKPEDQLLVDLSSPEASTVINAMEKIEDHYAASTNAHSALKKLLSDQRPNVRRKAARTLGNCRAIVDDSDVWSICLFFQSKDLDEILDGLKSLRNLSAPQATTRILPLLQHNHVGVLREACRTLGELGTREAIPVVQVLASHRDEDVREDAARALVRLKIRAAAASDLSPERGSKSSIGSGFVVATGGFILTCDHVVNGAKSIKIRDTLGGLHRASLVAADSANDLCLLLAPTFTNSPIPVVEVNSVVVGQTVYCLGFPLEGGEAKNLTPVVGNGVVASLRGLEGDSRHLQVTVAMNPGNSGGPVFDESGRWIGVAAHKLADLYSLRKSGELSQGFNFAVKSSLALTLFDAVPGAKLSASSKSEKVSLEELVKRLSQSVVCVIAN